jgi:ClpP class serine protease
MIALAANEIVMDSHAILGPVDPQLGEYPAASLVKAVKAKDVNKVSDKMLILADLGEKALAQMRSDVLELLADRMPADQATLVTDKLTQGTWTHDHPIGLKEAQELGLPARSDVPVEFYQLVALFPQPTQRQPTVQYDPAPYAPPTSPGEKSK